MRSTSARSTRDRWRTLVGAAACVGAAALSGCAAMVEFVGSAVYERAWSMTRPDLEFWEISPVRREALGPIDQAPVDRADLGGCR